MLGEFNGQNEFRHAASVIGGRKLGRTAIDDSAALQRIAAFPSDRRREAVGAVARQIGGDNAAKVDAIIRRLHRKLRKRASK